MIDFTKFFKGKQKQSKNKKNKSTKKGFDFSGWAGALSDMKDEYTSVQLQKKILEWRAERYLFPNTKP